MIAFLITTWHNRVSRHDYIRHEAAESLPFCDQIHPVLATDYNVFMRAGLGQKQAKHLSLTLAYQQIAQQADFMKLERYIVIEDDLRVTDRPALWESVEHLPDDFDVVYLTRTKHNDECADTVPYSDYFELIKGNWWETPITLWSGAFAKRFNDHIMDKAKEHIWTGHIDHVLVNLNAGKHYGAKRSVGVGLSTERKHAPGNISFETAIS